MISVDTNVLLRYVLQDHPNQSGRANRLFESGESILLCNIVLAETVWVLSGPKYRISRSDTVELIRSLIQEPNVIFEDSQLVWQALSLFRRAPRRQGKQADFADVLILLTSSALAEAKGGSFEAWFTFDQGALLLEGAASP
jgi:predicted nucleic-acid-binding protein